MMQILLICVLIVIIVAVVSLGFQVNDIAKRKIEQRTDVLADIEAEKVFRKHNGKYWKLIKVVSADDYGNIIHVEYNNKKYLVKQASNIGLTLYWSSTPRPYSTTTEFLSWSQIESLNPEWCASWADDEGEKVQVNKSELETMLEKAKHYDQALSEIDNLDLSLH